MARPASPLTHAWIWAAIDAVAQRNGLSPSALARLAGLDPTTFNRSKRFTPEGRPRWPSTESISKVLDATGMSLDEFAEQQLTVIPAAAGAKHEILETHHGTAPLSRPPSLTDPAHRLEPTAASDVECNHLDWTARIKWARH